MAFYEWKPEYTVSNERLDNDHKVLIGLIDRLHDCMLAGSKRESVEQILTELERYTIQHFAYEESQLLFAGYPGLATHKLVHVDLVRQLQKLIADFKGSRITISMAVMDFLKNWLTNHILGTDKGYAPYMAGQLARL